MKTRCDRFPQQVVQKRKLGKEEKSDLISIKLKLRIHGTLPLSFILLQALVLLGYLRLFGVVYLQL